MTVQLRCPRCTTVYVMEDGSAGSEVWCPACSVPMAPTVEPVAASPPPEAQPVAQQELVVCPRCNLHFKPRQEKVVPDRATTVLVAEAQPFFRQAAVTALEPVYCVKSASNLAETLVEIEAGSVDLLLLDQGLEGPEGGLALLRLIAAKRTFPVLLVSDRDETEMDEATWNEFRALGVHGIVLKNLNLADVVLGRIEATIGGEDLQPSVASDGARLTDPA